MQTPKESTKLNILKAAQNEFLKEGFAKASMRRIAKKANVSTSNIYNYFENKEGILKEIVKEMIQSIEAGIVLISSDDYLEQRLNFSYETIKARFNFMLDFVDRNRENLELLLFHSNGSEYENFLDGFIERLTQLNMKQLEFYKESKGLSNINAQHFLVRNLISFFLNIFVDMIKNKTSKEEILNMEDSFLKFLHYGSKAILLDTKES
jgi:AcrR family transcriptional regulator